MAASSITITNDFQGLGIALVAAQKAGVSVTLVDSKQASIDKGLKFAGNLCCFCIKVLC